MASGDKRSSTILLEIAQDPNLQGNLSYQQILHRLGQRAFGIALILFALPSALPFSAIPGISLIFSLPIAFFSIQMIVGKRNLWLPQRLATQTIPHKKMAKVICKTVPYLKKLEYCLQPRWYILTSQIMEMMGGFVILGLALLLMLPIPFSNFILSGLIIILSLGFLEKDGLFIVIGYVGTIVYVSFIYWVILSALKAIFR